MKSSSIDETYCPLITRQRYFDNVKTIAKVYGAQQTLPHENGAAETERIALLPAYTFQSATMNQMTLGKVSPPTVAGLHQTQELVHMGACPLARVVHCTSDLTRAAVFFDALA